MLYRLKLIPVFIIIEIKFPTQRTVKLMILDRPLTATQKIV
uniref:Uncharacterized protein n=1 Tax=uncultured marine bacterium 577 TaxID=257398 RepID=Q6SFY5_9BACT|nr:hypothetical protein MBMO_EBAC080-L12H07.26 [uncultured marine bacterium 577]